MSAASGVRFFLFVIKLLLYLTTLILFKEYYRREKGYIGYRGRYRTYIVETAKSGGVASSVDILLKLQYKKLTQLGVLTRKSRQEKASALKTLINRIYDNDPCILVDSQVRRKSDFELVMRARKVMINKMVMDDYVRIIDTVIHLRPKAVVMLDERKMIEWMTKHCTV